MSDAIVEAAIGGDVEGLRAMLASRPALPDDILQQTILSGNMLLDDVETVKLLLEAGAHPDEPNGQWSPLYAASMVGPFPSRSLAATELLLVAGADPNQVSLGETPLHVAVATIATDTTARLIAGGANVDAVDARGRTPTHVCLDALVDFATSDEDGELDLEELAQAEAYVVEHLRHLIAAGADLSIANADGDTPLASIFLRPHHPQRLRTILMDGGAPLDQPVQLEPGKRIDMLLAAVAATHPVDAIQRLVEHNDPMGRNEDMGGATALIVACSSYPDAALAIFEARPDLVKVVTEKKKATTLHCATASNHEGLIRFLLDAGVDPETPDAEGQTPLEFAMAHGFEQAAAYLLDQR